VAALIGEAAEPRAVLAAHVALELVDRRRLRPSHDVECDGLMGLAAQTADLQKAVAGVQHIAERRRWLRRAAEAQHALVPSLTGELVGFLPRRGRALGGDPDLSAVHPIT